MKGLAEIKADNARSKEIRVRCGHCQGKGTIELHGGYRSTLALVPTTGWVTTGWIAAAMPTVARTALIERLNTLVSHGLVERRKAVEARGLEWRRL